MQSDTIAPVSLVDLDRYALADLGSRTAAAMVEAARAQLAASGAAELPGFVTDRGLDALLAEAESLSPIAYRSRGSGPAYLDQRDTDLPADHPRRWRGRYSVGVVAYDQFPAASPLRGLYEWEPLKDLVAAVLGRGPLHRYADPLGALNLAVMGDGDELQWHFDQTDFVVSLAIRDADGGGDLEVCPRIRGDGDGDDGCAAVGPVLAGDRGPVVRLEMQPGTLLVFEGRHSLHRVSPVRGGTERLVGLLGYDTAPGTVSGERLRLARYGRTS